MTQETDHRTLLLAYFRAPEHEKAAAWAAMHAAGMVGEREPGRDDELPLLNAAE